MKTEALAEIDELTSNSKTTFSMIICLYSNTILGVVGIQTREHHITFNKKAFNGFP